MNEWAWLSIGVSVIALGLLLYWQLIIAEGVYLGQTVVTALYDLTARRYDGIKQFDPEIESFFLGRPLANVLRRTPAPLVLDVATGTGRLPRVLLEQPYFQGKIVGIDASWEMLKIAFQHIGGYKERTQLLCRDAKHMPFRDNWFDMVTCLEMLEFTPNPARQLQECFRVLKPGGHLVTTRRRGIDAQLMPTKTFSEELFSSLLARIGLCEIRIEPWQVDYDLVWARKPGIFDSGGHALDETIVCEHCHQSNFERFPNALRCEHCSTSIRVREGIIDFH